MSVESGQCLSKILALTPLHDSSDSTIMLWNYNSTSHNTLSPCCICNGNDRANMIFLDCFAGCSVIVAEANILPCMRKFPYAGNDCFNNYIKDTWCFLLVTAEWIYYSLLKLAKWSSNTTQYSNQCTFIIWLSFYAEWCQTKLSL